MTTKNDWTLEEIKQIFEQPFMDLLFRAHAIHRENFDANSLQMSTLLSIKTGRCPEDCAYCPQSARYKTNIEKHPLMRVEDIVTAAKAAKESGSTRFCMGAAWRAPPAKEFPQLITIIKAIRDLGMETCMTLGMLTQKEAQELADAGLEFYNHNLDTSPEYYDKIITTRTYQDRLDTLAHVRNAGMKSCCGGIMGLGESHEDRLSFLHALSTLPTHPESVPINHLLSFDGTPLAGNKPIDPIEFVRVIATARILMPTSVIRFACGRKDMSDELHALCFFAGANSIFFGEKLLASKNSEMERDAALLAKLKMNTKIRRHCAHSEAVTAL